MWVLGDSAYDVVKWHDHLLAAGVVPIAPHTLQITGDLKGIKYRVEARVHKHSEDVQLKQSVLDKQHNHRTGVERTNDVIKDCGLEHVCARSRVHARTGVSLALCFRIVVATTNYERA